MSNFNQPPGRPYGQANYVPQKPYGAPQQPPSGSGGGGNVWLVVLAILGGLFVLLIGACVFMAMMVKSGMEEFAGQFSELAAESVVESVVSGYEDHEIFVEKLGAVDDSKLEDEDMGLDVLTSRKVEIRIVGEKGEGVLILYRKGGNPDRVVLKVDGEEFLLDDNPSETLNEGWDEETWDEVSGDIESNDGDSGPGFGAEEFAGETAAEK